MKNSKIKKTVLSALFTAVITATAWISLPTPFGVNLAFTVFGIALSSFVLDGNSGVICTLVYILLGAAGIPVFSRFTGGIGVLFGVSGGFLWGFIILSFVCGNAKRIDKKGLRYALMTVSVLFCHAAGVAQFSLVSGNNVLTSFLSASFPFLLKDITVVFLAYFISKKIKL